MKTIFFTSSLFLSATASAIEPQFINAMEWKVLAINADTHMVAFKKIYAYETEEHGPIQCNYTGVKPEDFVQLGIWSLTDQKITQTWDVYPQMSDSGECASEETSKKTLQIAKEFFTAQKLDISTPPEFISPAKDETFTISKKDGSTRTFTISAPTETPLNPSDEYAYTYKRDITSKNAVVYHFETEGNRMMASTLSAEFERAYIIGNSVVFLQKIATSSMGGADIQYSFTPPISIE